MASVKKIFYKMVLVFMVQPIVRNCFGMLECSYVDEKSK